MSDVIWERQATASDMEIVGQLVERRILHVTLVNDLALNTTQATWTISNSPRRGIPAESVVAYYCPVSGIPLDQVVVEPGESGYNYTVRGNE